MRLSGVISESSGTVNEDGFGYIGTPQDISAAWVLDGVTGINGKQYFASASDAAWFVSRAQAHLLELAAEDMPLPEIIAHLIDLLISDLHEAQQGIALPPDYDPPAACLILVKRYEGVWKAVWLGDSSLLTRASGAAKAYNGGLSDEFEAWLRQEARKRRTQGMLDIGALLAEFRQPQLDRRIRRNTAAGYSILEASDAAKDFAEYSDLGAPDDILLCTDGFYRAVDTYAMLSDAELMDAAASPGGVKRILRDIRRLEASDIKCQTYPRFKPLDDATALALASI